MISSTCRIMHWSFSVVVCSEKLTSWFQVHYVVFWQGYGMTEACGDISLANPKEGSHLSSSTGTLLSGVECQIISIDTLQPLPPNQLGEIWFRGPNMMQGWVFGSMFLTRFLVLTGHMLISQSKVPYRLFFPLILPVVKKVCVTNFAHC